MILELAKALNTAHFVLDGDCVTSDLGHNEYDMWCTPTEDVEEEPEEYRWVRAKRANYEWAASLLYNLCGAYATQNGRAHLVEASGLLMLLINESPYNMPPGPFMDGITEIPQSYALANQIAYIEASHSFLEYPQPTASDFL